MHVTANLLNNSKENLYKTNTQFASDTYNKTNNQSIDQLSVKTKVEVADKSTVTKVDVAQSLLSTAHAIVEVTMDIAVQTIEGNVLPPGTLDEFEEKYKKVMKELDPSFAVFRHTKIGDGYIFDGENIFGGDRKESSLTFEDGELLYNGAPVNDGTVEDIEEADDDGNVEGIEEGVDESVEEEGNVVSDTALDSSIKSFYTLGFGTDGNGKSNNLYSLLDDFASDIREGDTSNMEAYLEKLTEYEDIILSVQADLDHEDPAMAITKFKNQEDTYQACLAMQPNIFQPTLSDYVS